MLTSKNAGETLIFKNTVIELSNCEVNLNLVTINNQTAKDIEQDFKFKIEKRKEKKKSNDNIVDPQEVYNQFNRTGINCKDKNFDKDKLKELLGHVKNGECNIN